MSERLFRSALLVLGHGVFIALGVLSLEHAVTRATWGDTAFQLFQWISQPGWDIEAHRYTAVLPQATVKLVSLFGPDLRTLLYTASLAHVLVGYGVFVLCAHKWKANEAAVGCAVAAVLCTRLTFYSPVLEANYLLCFPFLAAGYMEQRSGTSWSAWAIGALLLFILVALFAHPMGWMVMLFVVAWAFVQERLPLRVALLFGLLLLAWPLITRVLFPPTGYELGQYEKVERGLRGFSWWCRWESLRYLRLHTFCATTNYLPALLALVASTIGWCVLRRYWTVLVLVGGTLAFLLVYAITFHEGDSAMMMDRGILPVATLIAIGAAPLALRTRGTVWRSVVLVAMALVFFIKLRDVSFASRPYVAQVRATEALAVQAREQGIDRGIVDCDALRAQGADINWAFPVEMLLRSSVNGPEHGCILVCAKDPPSPRALASGDLQVLGMFLDPDKNGNGYFAGANGPYRAFRQP